MKNYLTLCLLLIIFIFLSSCKKKCHELQQLNFSQSEINLIPYHGTGYLDIAGSNTTSILLKSDGINNNWYDINSNSASIIDEQPCSGDYYSIQNYQVSFSPNSTTSDASYISIELLFDNPFSTNVVNKYFQIAIGATYDHAGAFVNNFILNNGVISPNESTAILHDTLRLDTTLFHSVYEFHGYHQWSNYIKIVYYTVDYGIVALYDYKNDLHMVTWVEHFDKNFKIASKSRNKRI